MTSRPSIARSRPLRVLLVIIAVGVGVGAWQGLRREEPAAETVTLAQLAFGQEDYSGRRVRTGGVVQRFGPADGARRLHYVIADEADNRVRLLGVDPTPYLGQAVEVVGRFRLTDTSGRTIDVERVEAR